MTSPTPIVEVDEVLEQGDDVTQLVHLIDDNGNLSNNFKTFLKASGIVDKNVDYSIMAVFGPQSSGKSTLLNTMFNTRFPTLNASQGVQQTTQGILAARPKKQSIIVLDLEGSDSKERGEKNTGFEKKISLFALALSEVLIINTWYKDFGRLQASGYVLLKSILELNLQLFAKQSKTKTLLLFLVRDHSEEYEDTPLIILEKQARDNIIQLWKEIVKPKEFESASVFDFFDFEIYSLPYYRIKEQKPKFEQKCKDLSDRFVDSSNPAFVFKTQYKKAVPAIDLQDYVEQIWGVVKSNKDLDIPTQKEMVSNHRCKAIIKELTCKEPEIQAKNWEDQIDKEKDIPDLGANMGKVLDTVVDMYNNKTVHYSPNIVDQNREDLRKIIVDRFKRIFERYMDAQVTKLGHNLENVLVKAFPEGSVVEGFQSTVDEIQQTILNQLDDIAKLSVIPGVPWDYESKRASLKNAITTHVENARAKQIRLIVEHRVKEITQIMDDKIKQVFQRAEPNMWDQLRSIMFNLDTEIDDDDDLFIGVLTATADISEKLQELKNFCNAYFKTLIGAFVKDNLRERMFKKFEDRFKYSGSTLRIWKPKDNIQEICKKARIEALSVLDLFFLNRLLRRDYDNVHLTFPAFDDRSDENLKYPKLKADIASPLLNISDKSLRALYGKSMAQSFEEKGPEVEPEHILLEVVECRKIYASFDRHVRENLQDALRQQSLAASNMRIPWWLFLVIAVLGFDEFLYLLSHPLLLLVILVLVVLFAKSYLQDYLAEFLQTGPTSVTIPLRMVLEKLPFKVVDIENTAEEKEPTPPTSTKPKQE